MYFGSQWIHKECVWKNLYPIIIMKDHIAGKGTVHCNIITRYKTLFLCLKPWRFPQQRQQWINNGRTLTRFGRGTWRMSEVRKRWSMKQGRRAQKFIFASLMDICHLKNAELEAKHQKNKGRVVLRDDIVKDDFGSYEVFTEQGSSASQMTAAKVMDIISRLPACAGQAADAVFDYTKVKMEYSPKLLKILTIGMCRHLDTSTTTQMAQIMVQYGRPSRSSWAKSVRSSFGRTVMSTAIREDPIKVQLVEGFQLGMLIRTPWKRVVLICVCRSHYIGWKETKHWYDVESTQ